MLKHTANSVPLLVRLAGKISLDPIIWIATIYSNIGPREGNVSKVEFKNLVWCVLWLVSCSLTAVLIESTMTRDCN